MFQAKKQNNQCSFHLTIPVHAEGDYTSNDFQKRFIPVTQVSQMNDPVQLLT